MSWWDTISSDLSGGIKDVEGVVAPVEHDIVHDIVSPIEHYVSPVVHDIVSPIEQLVGRVDSGGGGDFSYNAPVGGDFRNAPAPSRKAVKKATKQILEHSLIGGGIVEIGAEGLPELGGEAEQLATHYGLTTLGKGLVGGAAAAVGGELYEHFRGGAQMAVNAEHGTIIKKWSANGAQFEEYSDGTISVLKKNGRVKNYRPYHPKVFGKKLKINAFLSLAKKYEKDYKGLKKIFERHARRK